MKKSLPLLLFLLACGLAAIGYIFLKDEGRNPNAGLEAGRSAIDGEAEPGEDEVLELNEEQQAQANSRGERLRLSNDVRLLGDWEPKYLDGQVKFPPGSPADDSLRVLVLSVSRSPSQVFGGGGLLHELRKDPSAEPKGLLAISQVAADGSFSLPYPADSERIWLALDGSFLFLDRTHELSLPAAGCELSPQLGGLIQVQLELPAAESHGPKQLTDELALETARVLLDPDPTKGSAALLSNPWSFTRFAMASEESGSLVFRAVPSGLTQRLRINSPIFVDHEELGIHSIAGKELSLTVPLSHGGSLAGLVLAPDGATLAGAQVTYSTNFNFGIASGAAALAISDEEGRFLLTGLDASQGSLSATADGFKSAEPLKLELAEEQHTEGLLLQVERGISLVGRVIFSDESGAEGVRIRAGADPTSLIGLGVLDADKRNKAEVRSDAQGRFELRGLGSGPYEIDAVLHKTEGINEGLWFRRISALKDSPGEIELLLERTSRVLGQVKDSGGEAVTSFSLSVGLKDANQQAPGGRPKIKDLGSTDPVEWAGHEQRALNIENAQGEFALEALTAGTWSITVHAEGFADSAPLQILMPNEAGVNHQISMTPEATLAGQVLTPHGDPVSGAIVSLILDRAGLVASARGQSKVPQAVSDEEGRFLLKQLSPGPQGVYAKHADFADSGPANIDPLAGQSLTSITLTLTQGGSINGLVYGKDGKPSDGVRVIIQDTAVSNLPVLTNSADGGTFGAEHLTPGKYQVTAIFTELDGSGKSAMSSLLENMMIDVVEVVEGEETELIMGKAPLSAVQVSGRATYLNKPLANALVAFLPEDGTGVGDMKITGTDDDGNYSVQLKGPGLYMVTLQVLSNSGGQQQQVEFSRNIPEGETRQLDFAMPGARLSGRVEDSQGKPISNARISLSIDGGATAGTLMGGHFAELITDTEGRYTLDYLHEGSYSVTAGGSAYGGAIGVGSSYGRQIQSGIKVGEDELRSGIDFRLGGAGSIEGNVLDPAGQPVAEASIFVRDERGRLLERFTLNTSAATGRFKLTGLAPGNYTLSAQGKHSASRLDASVRVQADTAAEAKLVIDAGTMLVVELNDKTNQAIAGASLSVKNDAGQEVSGMFNMAALLDRLSSGFKSNVFQVGPLPPGKYSVVVVSPDGRSLRKKVIIDDRGRPERKFKLTFK